MSEVYRDPSLSASERTIDLLSRMTIEEKVGQMCQLDLSHDPKIWIKERNIGSYLNVKWKDTQVLQKMALETRLGIPLIFGVDAVHGHCFHDGATVFPSQLAMSCSWNPELLEEVARITAREVIHTGFHWTFAPILCIGRDPRWGRISETFGEDPFLIGNLASAMVRGYQGKSLSDPESILACPKHFVAYGETIGGRDSAEAEVSRRKLRSIFLPPFKAVVDTGCDSIMAGYHSIDGTPCSANSWLLKDLLKKEWGFKGFVLTDWANINWLHEMQYIAPTLADAAEIALLAGNDMMMSTPEFYNIIIKMIKEGHIDEKVIDDACSRILNVKFRLGLFEQKGLLTSDSKVIGCLKHKKKALEAALQSLVLLKNDNDLLPLKENIGKIAVLGPNADNSIAQLGDWSFGKVLNWPPQDSDIVDGHKDNTVTILDGIKKRVKDPSSILYVKGCDVLNPEDQDIQKAVQAAMEANVAIVVVGDSYSLNGERKDRASLDLTGAQHKLLDSIKRTETPLIVVLINGKPLTIPWIAENADAILEAWNPGNEGGNAVAAVLFGDFNPSGKLTISFPRHIGQLPVYYNQMPGWHGGKYVDMDAEPLFPFGYGLSYTSFQYSNLRCSTTELQKHEVLTVSIDIKNTGNHEGTEIVQLYVNDKYSSVTTPIKELKGFSSVNLHPGEEKCVNLVLPISSLSLINSEGVECVEPGEFEILVGGSSRDNDLLKKSIFVH
ncbi:MAG: glycoside hydrolase family 3 C-terminal domain-containing protein [Candidatus Heimdallarchaeota archaeon]|nr:MAG: glycoside hydrolase family 3 C-terminal domain-containing protein [Candidatus Heimdallarchaeota archaeon]